MTSLTDINPIDIITRIGDFNRTQAAGLNCLIFLSVRERTTIAYQHKECCFGDIPIDIVAMCDQLDDDALLDLAGRITLALIMEKTAAALEEENAQHVAVQAIDHQN
ncbi:MAG: hypothetical protein V7L25_30955 [Nostoc sp.]|uniref:hypothetical protein n=1 Tax=Nostoc sp. TaxID=1180 RepID=UPI002FF42D56